MTREEMIAKLVAVDGNPEIVVVVSGVQAEIARQALEHTEWEIAPFMRSIGSENRVTFELAGRAELRYVPLPTYTQPVHGEQRILARAADKAFAAAASWGYTE